MIPVIDSTAPDLSDQLGQAFERIGFATLINHGIDSCVFDQLRTLLGQLFSLPDDEKAALRITPENYRGFIPLGFFTPNRTDRSGHAPDLYEGYKLHWECPPDHPVAAECRLYGPNRWPASLPDLRGAIERYWAACDQLTARLLDALADRLSVARPLLRAHFAAPLTNMTLLHYPPTTDHHVGIHPHKDTNVITLLHPDPTGGLQVRNSDGTWIEPTDPTEQALVVNVGEMLELWSGGRFRATPHRVINQSGRDRYSFPFFVVPNHASVIEPLVEPLPDYHRDAMPVGALSDEVWQTNWPDRKPHDGRFDLGTLDRQ